MLIGDATWKIIQKETSSSLIGEKCTVRWPSALPRARQQLNGISHKTRRVPDPISAYVECFLEKVIFKEERRNAGKGGRGQKAQRKPRWKQVCAGSLVCRSREHKLCVRGSCERESRGQIMTVLTGYGHLPVGQSSPHCMKFSLQMIWKPTD